MKHVIESQQFDRELIDLLFRSANALAKNSDNSLQGKIMASLFYEPSTRTRFSFESAMIRLGGSVITTENASEFSSTAKGETLEDTIRVINNYADVLVLRHPEEGASERASKVSDVPIINAGDGGGQHPTQALLDLYTIYNELRKIDGVRVALSGDLKHGRTVRSLAYLLGKYDDIKIYFVSPEDLRVGKDILEYLDRHDVEWEERRDLDPIVGDVDVLYQTRIQKERFDNQDEYEKLKGSYKVDLETLKKMKPEAILMHPLPRIDEIPVEVDVSRKAVYFKQAHYGSLIRMALLKHVLLS